MDTNVPDVTVEDVEDVDSGAAHNTTNDGARRLLVPLACLVLCVRQMQTQ